MASCCVVVELRTFADVHVISASFADVLTALTLMPVRRQVITSLIATYNFGVLSFLHQKKYICGYLAVGCGGLQIYSDICGRGIHWSLAHPAIHPVSTDQNLYLQVFT